MKQEEARSSRWAMTKRSWLASCLFSVVAVLHAPAHAQGAPKISPSLKSMLGGLPLAGMKEQVQGMVAALEKTPCGGALKGCYATSTGPLQLYFFSSGTAQQTLLLVIDQQMVMPNLLSEKAQKFMGGTALRSPIIAISTTDFALDQVKMPPALQKVVRERYFNVNALEFAAGVQLASRADLGGPIKLAMEAFGVKGNEITLRAAVVMPIPTDLVGAAGAGAGAADAIAHGATMKKAGADALSPEAFVELQFAPNASLQLLMPRTTLTDATFFLNNAGTFGFKGNSSYEGAPNKPILMHFQTPMNPAGALDLLDYSFRMATPASFTMEDAANIMVGMASTDKRLAPYGGGFIRNIEKFKNPLLTAAKPLSVFKLNNPVPVPVYRFGNSQYPWPEDDKVFNFVVLGPLADGGPLLQGAGNVEILGQKMGWLDASAGVRGLRATVGEAITLKLGPLGKVRVQMEAVANVDSRNQDISLKGNFSGQRVEVTLSGNHVTAYVNATCANPFEIHAQTSIEASSDIVKIFEGAGAINVDPAKLPNCIGKELEAAYKKIAGDYKALGGYTADAANIELKKIKDNYEAVKSTARSAANASTNAANSAFKAAENAFKGFGKKKRSKAPPDPRFESSVFDWDYYYDTQPEVVAAGTDLSTHWRDTGFAKGLRGSSEFDVKYYRSRYLDVQALCVKSDYTCALNHWLDHGLPAGRQGSPDFSVANYINRYSDLKDVFGNGDYAGAMGHWLGDGSPAGRRGKPYSTADGPVMGPVRIGGGDGGAWSDDAVCNGEHVIGWRIYSGDQIGRLQFRYPGGWAPAQGGKDIQTEVNLAAGEYIVRVDYRSGSEVDRLAFTTNTGKTYGPYGGSGGSPGTYNVTPGEKLGCMQGRSGSRTDQLTFTSTGLR